MLAFAALFTGFLGGVIVGTIRSSAERRAFFQMAEDVANLVKYAVDREG
jgi:hypothetical protein